MTLPSRRPGRASGLTGKFAAALMAGVFAASYTGSFAAEAKPEAITITDPVKFERNKRIVRLNEEVNAESAAKLIAELRMLDEADPKHHDITLIINSPGGIVTAGLAIYDAIKSLQSDVRTVCEGECDSMAAVLLIAGTPGKRSAMPDARIMIHQPSGGASGKVTDVMIDARELEFLKDKLATIVASYSGLDKGDVINMMERDHYVSPEDAVRLGMIDRVESLRHRPPVKPPRRVADVLGKRAP